nr:hypothetical protein Iba_chr13aCG0590 [Ipomoea batatas]GMD79133.1 hypothetical protein Iba_chr13dCG0890 [Ipomoea batatas]
MEFEPSTALTQSSCKEGSSSLLGATALMYSISNIFSSEIFFARRNSSSDILINSPPMRKSKGSGFQSSSPALRRLLTTAERPKRVRLDGMAMEVGGALNGGFSFVTNRTCTRFVASSASISIFIL